MATRLVDVRKVLLLIMKPPVSISLLALLIAGCASPPVAHVDVYFQPCQAKASVSFEGETQAGGREVHRLEVRRLAYVRAKQGQATMSSCVIYYAGKEYGPFILHVMDDCLDPLVRKVSSDIVEIYFLAGANAHIRQQWRLLGWTAKLEKEEGIDWSEDPRVKPEAPR